MHGGRARDRREAATASWPTADPFPDLELIGAYWASKGELGVGRVAATASRPTSRLDPELDSIGAHLACTAVEHGIGGRRRRHPGRPPTPSSISSSSERTGHRRGSSGSAGWRRRHFGQPSASSRDPSHRSSLGIESGARGRPGGGDSMPAELPPRPVTRAIGSHLASKAELGVGREAVTASRPTFRLVP